MFKNSKNFAQIYLDFCFSNFSDNIFSPYYARNSNLGAMTQLI